MTTHDITIDMDKACSECGEKGAAPNGLCLSCVTRHMEAEAARKANNFISMDCKVDSARTDWEKKSLKVTLATPQEDTEREGEMLGEIARMASMVKVSICQKTESLNDAIVVKATIEAVKLDWKIEKLTITLDVDGLVDDLMSKATRLGFLAHMELACTVRFEAAQGRLF